MLGERVGREHVATTTHAEHQGARTVAERRRRPQRRWKSKQAICAVPEGVQRCPQRRSLLSVQNQQRDRGGHADAGGGGEGG